MDKTDLNRLNLKRRRFLKIAIGATAVGLSDQAHAEDRSKAAVKPQIGCLVDTTLCIGCRKCEEACNRANHLPRPERSFEDRHVLRKHRRPSSEAFTVVNSYPGEPSRVQMERDETFVKVQCMHCLDPACVSACIVGALTKSDEGPVLYDADKCIGCRYCLVACPFEIPSYEYLDPITPRVRKCTYCVNEQRRTSAQPACAAACPVEAILFGTRDELVSLAHRRIEERPDRYVDHVYGEHEVGGTSWLYLAGRPMPEINLVDLPQESPPRLTESIQHGIFNYGAVPLALYGGLAGLMWLTNRRHSHEGNDE